jgi:aspartate racemase
MATPSQPVGQTVSRYGILRKIGGAPNRLPRIRAMCITHPLLWLFLCTSPLLYAQSPQLPPPSNMKVLGLIGGTSWYSTVEYYEYLNRAVNDAYRNNTNPPLILYNMNQQKIHDLQAANDWDSIAALYTEAARRLRASGAQGIVFCANTPHKVYVHVARNVDIPILHIADATGVAIKKAGLKKVGIIGTLYTMRDGFISDWLKEHYGIDSITLTSEESQRELHRIIQQELQLGLFKPASRKYVLQQIEELRKRGAEGIVLACTEFPLIIRPEDVSVPIFDTTLLHSQMAADFILGKPGIAEVRRRPR